MKINKRGFSYFGLAGYFVIILVVVTLAMANSNIDKSNVQDSIDNLNWTKTFENISRSLDNSKVGSEDNALFVFAIDFAKKGVDLAGFCYFSIARLAMQFSLDHPDIVNYKVLLYLLILSLIAPVIFPAFTIIVSVFLIIKEAIKNKKERREISLLKEKKRIEHE